MSLLGVLALKNLKNMHTINSESYIESILSKAQFPYIIFKNTNVKEESNDKAKC